jgi:integrase
MKEVEAVKKIEQVNAITFLLEKHHSSQFSDIWNLGINLALRITDLLSITKDQVNLERGTISIIEDKTNKSATIKLNHKALEIVTRLMTNKVFLFESTSRNVNTVKHLSRQAVAQAFKSVGEIVGVHLGTHSMRKTRGYHLYKKTNDIASVMKMLRHSNQATTLKYIGITQEDIDNDFMELVL